MRSGALSIAVAAVMLVGCPKGKPAGEDAAPSTSASTSTKGEDNGVILGGGSKGDAGTDASTGAAYTGKYTVALGAMYVPDNKDWSSVKFKNDETKLLGDGEMSIAIDPSGRVSGGTEAGPLGASVIEGTSQAGNIAATIRRKDPTDDGLTGTLVGKVTADAIEA